MFRNARHTQRIISQQKKQCSLHFQDETDMERLSHLSKGIQTVAEWYRQGWKPSPAWVPICWKVCRKQMAHFKWMRCMVYELHLKGYYSKERNSRGGKYVSPGVWRKPKGGFWVLPKALEPEHPLLSTAGQRTYFWRKQAFEVGVEDLKLEFVLSVYTCFL